MDPKKCARVAECEFHAGVHGNHISSHSRKIRTCLNLELLKLYALQEEEEAN